MSKGLVKKDVNVPSTLIQNGKVYLNQFVIKYQDEIPEVVEELGECELRCDRRHLGIVGSGVGWISICIALVEMVHVNFEARKYKTLLFSIEICWRNCLRVYLPLRILYGLQVPLAGVDYPWDGEAIPSYDAPISPVREPTPGSTSCLRIPVPQVGVLTQSNRRRLATAVQPLEPTELVQSLISAFTAQGESFASASNDDPSTEVVKD
ncbi:hypothetical protein GIB67_010705 [Kingdonia uniflora]|uniref:Uncharacterized protein n=1 Tax=Kingdonia uniflora TaxID=39325 RepID=A0A7J7L8T7_9MAGN|nr:hypothetical protein GIB67_010705 [Kingdonia uniflora]